MSIYLVYSVHEYIFSVQCTFVYIQDWDKASTPLKTSGKEPKFVKPPDKFSATEGDHAFVILDIQGDPVPKIEWFKVSYL